MLDQIKQLIAEISDFSAATPEDVEQFRIKHLGKKGTIAALFDAFKSVPVEQKKEFGKALNELKTAALVLLAGLAAASCSDASKMGPVPMPMTLILSPVLG